MIEAGPPSARVAQDRRGDPAAGTSLEGVSGSGASLVLFGKPGWIALELVLAPASLVLSDSFGVIARLPR